MPRGYDVAPAVLVVSHRVQLISDLRARYEQLALAEDE